MPFTSFGGDKGSPAFSPDGNELAFIWQGENPKNLAVYDIYVQLVGTSSPLRLTNAQAREDFPAWSTDGRFIAFWRRPAGSAFGASQLGAYYIVPALGGPERKLADMYREGFSGGGVAWSPDGKYLAVADGGNKPGLTGTAIFFISVESGERRESRIEAPGSFVSCPTFSPDGKYLAFISGPGFLSTDVYVASVTGGKARALTSVHSSMGGIAWTPDGQQLVFDSTHQGSPTLWRVPLSGGDPELLSAATDNAIQPTIALHGNRLAFQRYAVDTNLWKAPASPSDPASPIRIVAATQEDSDPAFSPDGQRIAFASSRSGSSEIYVSGADGSNPSQLTSMKTGSTGSPAWSPDGKQIAFDSRAQGHGDIFVINSEGGSPRRITNGPSDSYVPSWSQDGRWIYFTSDHSGSHIWKVSPDGGDPVPVGKNDGNGVVESWDGRSLYYFRENAVWKSDLNGGNEIRLIEASGFQNWRVCGKDICVLNKSAAPAGQFIRYNPITRNKQIKQLDVGPRVDASQGMSVSPDGRWVVYTRADSLQSDIMMIENFH